jgi:hypothetical protein
MKVLPPVFVFLSFFVVLGLVGAYGQSNESNSVLIKGAELYAKLQGIHEVCMNKTSSSSYLITQHCTDFFNSFNNHTEQTFNETNSDMRFLLANQSIGK